MSYISSVAPPAAVSLEAGIGERVRASRLTLGATQASLAAAVGITQSALSNYENGKREPSLPLLTAIAGALHVSLGDLLGDAMVLSARDARLREVTRLLIDEPALLDALVREAVRQAPTAASAPPI